MPLLVLTSGSTPTPSPTPTVPGTPPPQRPRLTWTRDGVVTHLSEVDARALAGARGLDMPPFVHYRDESPAVEGAFSRGHRTLVREIFLPLAIQGATREEFLDRKRSLLRRMDPDQGPGTLTWAEPDGSRRHIEAFYQQGLEGDYASDSALPNWQRFGLVLEALSPYWYGDDVALTWAGSGAARPFYPYPGVDTFYEVVSPSQVLGTTSVDNAGDKAAYPRWTVKGPSTGITFTNTTTGKVLTLAATMTDAQRRIIDTRQGHGTIVDELGNDKWPELADGSSLWTLARGVNELSIVVDGSTGDTRATLTYEPRFNGV